MKETKDKSHTKIKLVSGKLPIEIDKLAKKLKFRRTKTEIQKDLSVEQAKMERLNKIMSNVYEKKTRLQDYHWTIWPTARQFKLAYDEKRSVFECDKSGEAFKKYLEGENDVLKILLDHEVLVSEKEK